MNSSLLAIEIGPVQSFIEAARRTRDLWFGSYVVSQVAKAAARAIAHECGDSERGDDPTVLIFPATDDKTDLEQGSELAVADVILAEVPTDKSATAAVKAKKAVAEEWRSYADPVKRDFIKLIHEDLWDDQVGDVFECYAAWVPLGTDYPKARRDVMRLLAGRTACRDFLPTAVDRDGRPKGAGIPKSSLDGSRESVLKPIPRDEQGKPKIEMKGLRVNVGEQLDAIGLTKRLGAGKRPYPSVSRIAADPWLDGIAKFNPTLLDPLLAECGRQEATFATIDKQAYPHYQDFPFEGTAVYLERYPALEKEGGISKFDLKYLREPVEKLRHDFGEPDPYLAAIAADGDRVGSALDKVTTSSDHRVFSQALSKFSGRARAIVAEHRGATIFAGGDDVLALVPVDQALACSRKLHKAFRKMGGLPPGVAGPTLSVGVAIGHFLDDLGDLIHRAKDAEWMAKGAELPATERRNALGIVLQPRGGSPIRLRGRWDVKEPLDEAVAKWVQLLNSDGIPDKVAYDLRRLTRDYKGWENGDQLAEALRKDARRLLSRKSGDGLKEIDDLLKFIATPEDLVQVAETIIVARRIAVAVRQRDRGKRA